MVRQGIINYYYFLNTKITIHMTQNGISIIFYHNIVSITMMS